MSWYKYQAVNRTKEQSVKRPSLPPPRAIPVNKLNKEIPVMLTITNLNTPADGESLSQALLKMEGVIRAEPIPHQKKLAVRYNPALININSITYKISSLGYHYVQRG